MERIQPASVGIALRLRTATRGTHDRVDGAFPQGLATPEDYVRYLLAILPLAQWLHDSWRPDWAAFAPWHEPARLQHLRSDLRRLGAAPDAGTGLEEPAGCASEWIGGCYVLEGSAVGARLLARDLDRIQPRHPRIAGARGFIDSHLADPRRWARFRSLLDSLSEDAGDAAIRGAHRGFGLVEDALTAMEAPA